MVKAYYEVSKLRKILPSCKNDYISVISSASIQKQAISESVAIEVWFPGLNSLIFQSPLSAEQPHYLF